jgi:hypothetical protein
LVAKTKGSVIAKRALWVTPVIIAVLAIFVLAAPGARSALAAADTGAADRQPAAMVAPGGGAVAAPSEDSVRALVSHLFPKARPPRGQHSGPVIPPTQPADPAIPSDPSLPALPALPPLPPLSPLPPMPDLPALPPMPDGDSLPALPALPDGDALEDLIEGALEDVLGGDIDLDLDLDIDVDDDPQSVDIHIDGPDFSIDISLPDVRVEIDIPELGMLNEVIEEQLASALREFTDADQHGRGSLRKQLNAQRKRHEQVQKQWRQWRLRRDRHRDHTDCDLE